MCDIEEYYAQHMSQFLRSHKEIPWEVQTYTSAESLLAACRETIPALLVISENACTQELLELKPSRTILLNESGILRDGTVKNIDKFQKAELVYQELIKAYIEWGELDLLPPRLEKESAYKDIVFIGMYSPVRRCMQTPFALTLGQMLAEEHKTLYLNFEHFAGMGELLPNLQTRDLADLLYFLSAEKEKFIWWMETIRRQVGKLDVIPPMKNGENLIQVSREDWMEFLKRLAQIGSYQYIILDLSESVQGLLDILRLCKMVFMLTKDDHMAESKINQYEQVLSLYEHEDILQKTLKCRLPHFRRLPDQMEQFTKGEFADYVKETMEEMLL
jgi:hypothetical protein